MDYLITKEIVLTLFTCGCIVLAVYSSMRLSKEIRDEAAKNRESFMELLKHSIDTIKSTSLEERVNAVALEGQHDIQLQMMKDAMDQERDILSEENIVPRFVHAEDGTKLDLNEYEIL